MSDVHLRALGTLPGGFLGFLFFVFFVCFLSPLSFGFLFPLVFPVISFAFKLSSDLASSSALLGFPY